MDAKPAGSTEPADAARVVGGWRFVESASYMRDPLAYRSEGRGYASYLGSPDVALWGCWTAESIKLYADVLSRLNGENFECRQVDSVVGTMTECSNVERDDSDLLTLVFQRDVLIAVGYGGVRPAIDHVIQQVQRDRVCR